MNWYKIASNSFEYKEQEREFWRNLVYKAEENFSISFDLENDSNIGQIKKIKVDGAQYANDKPYYLLAQLYFAGGDWQNTAAYFRCQLMSGGKKMDKFVFIPSKKDGNSNLILSGKKYKYIVSSNEKDQKEIDEKKCWDALKKYTLKYISKECPCCKINGKIGKECR
jgi:hypothetical protein